MIRGFCRLGDLIQIDPESDKSKMCFIKENILEIAEKHLSYKLFFGRPISESKLNELGVARVTLDHYIYHWM